MAHTTGGAGTITFGALGSFAFRTLEGSRGQAPQVQATELGNVGHHFYVVPDTQELQPFTAEIIFDPLLAIPAGITSDTITITFPVSVAGNTPATLAGTGWFSAGQYPRFEHNQLLISPVEMQWEGGEQQDVLQPVFTAETA